MSDVNTLAMLEMRMNELDFTFLERELVREAYQKNPTEAGNFMRQLYVTRHYTPQSYGILIARIQHKHT